MEKKKLGNPNWVKGVSGNPGGRPKDAYDIRMLAQERTLEALNVLAEIMLDKDAPHAARVSAANAILDRGHGKPMQTAEITGKNGEALIPDNMELARSIAFVLNKATESSEESSERNVH